MAASIEVVMFECILIRASIGEPSGFEFDTPNVAHLRTHGYGPIGPLIRSRTTGYAVEPVPYCSPGILG
jgi:hypothetical protein